MEIYEENNLMRIHELEYEIDNPLNMQARTVDYNSWKEYIEKCA